MKYPELRPYTLVGGTALAIRIQHRLSEDIDLFAYQNFPGKKFNLPKIDALTSKFKNSFEVKIIYSDNSNATLTLNGVKVQLRAENQFHGPKKNDVTRLENIALPKEETLLGMKLVALSLRDTWRDVFDLTCLARRHELPSFYAQYKKVMSTYYCGSEKNRINSFNTVMDKLKNTSKLKALYRQDPMTELITGQKITPEIVRKPSKTSHTRRKASIKDYPGRPIKV